MKEFFCSDGTVLDLDCGGDYTNLYMGSVCIELAVLARWRRPGQDRSRLREDWGEVEGRVRGL